MATDSLPAAMAGLKAQRLTIVAKDFVIEAYHNGHRLPATSRKKLLDRFGAMVERIELDVKAGDWLVFHVANNRLRHGGSKYFAVTGQYEDGRIGFVSRPDSPQWSVCDSAAQSFEFIHFREAGTEARARPIAKPWEEGRKFMKQYAKLEEFPGEPIWGSAPSTWIKFVVPQMPDVRDRVRIESPSIAPPTKSDKASKPRTQDRKAKDKKKSKGRKKPEADEAPPTEPLADEAPPEPKGLAILEPKVWPVQILSATYGTGGHHADVTERVKELVEDRRAFFAANPGHLGVDPKPYWNKGLHIVYMKDGVRREQRRNENEHILPESFYGPQDAGELKTWIVGTRWEGPQGEVQFHPQGVLAGPGIKGRADWKAIEPNWVEISWPDRDKPVRYVFDYVWSRFSEHRNAAEFFRLMP